MSDLAERLKGVIEEKLAIARAAGGGEWLANMPTVYMDGHSAGSIRPAGGGPYIIQGTFRGGVHQFVETHDPAWAIRQHEAALRVLERHRPMVGDPRWCVTCTRDGGIEAATPCIELADLAKAYAIPTGGPS